MIPMVMLLALFKINFKHSTGTQNFKCTVAPTILRSHEPKMSNLPLVQAVAYIRGFTVLFLRCQFRAKYEITALFLKIICNLGACYMKVGNAISTLFLFFFYTCLVISHVKICFCNKTLITVTYISKSNKGYLVTVCTAVITMKMHICYAFKTLFFSANELGVIFTIHHLARAYCFHINVRMVKLLQFHHACIISSYPPMFVDTRYT